MKAFIVVALAVVGAVLVAACSNADEATPSPTAPTSTSAPPIATRTVIPTSDVLFCEAERAGVIGFIRYEEPQPAECGVGGFLLQTRLPADVVVGDFVPRCLQPVHDEGSMILVGHLCVTESNPHAFTTDPRPAEFANQLNDGDLIPFCDFDISSGELSITRGPPCIIGGEGFGSIATDSLRIEELALCGAGLSYFFESAEWLAELLDLLPTEAQDASRDDLDTLRDSLMVDPGALVQRFFATWGDRSPIVMNTAIGEALDSLEANDTPEARESLRAQAQDAIDWYTAGRGC